MEGLRPFSRIFDFSGRSGRAEFWQFHAIMWSVMIAASLIEYVIGDRIGILTGLIGLACAIPQISVTVRRYHDTGRSGQTLAFYAVLAVVGIFLIANAETAQGAFKGYGVILVGVGYTLYVAVKRGDEGENAYGYPDGVEMLEAPRPQYPVNDHASGWTPPAQASSADDTMTRIERLGSLRDRGLLSEDEFLSQKAAILAQG